MTISVLGIVGSPRANGSTRQVVDEALRGASEAGGTTHRVLLAEHDIAGCRGCNACVETGECIQQDGMNPILD